MVSPSVAIGLEWSFLVLAYVAVAARVYVRIIIKRDRLRWSDSWLLAALVCAQGLLICDTATYLKGDMGTFTDPSTSLMKIRFATNYFFDVGIYFPKLSIIALYYMIVPPTKSTMRKVLHILTMFTVSACLFALFANTFWCGPDPSINWLVESPLGVWFTSNHLEILYLLLQIHHHRRPSGCSSWASMDLMRVNWALNFSTEILNLFFPFPLLGHLKLSTRRERLSLGLIFAMGFITIGVSIGRFVTMVYLENAVPVYIWATAEFCTSIVIVAMTALRPLLKKITKVISSTMGGTDVHKAYRLSDNEHNVRSKRGSPDKVEMGMHWSIDSEFRTQRSISSRGDKNDNVVELNGLGTRKILKTEEFSISSEFIR